MAEKPPLPKLTEAQTQALIGNSFRACTGCGALIIYQRYAHHGGPLNGPQWETCHPPLNPVCGTPHICPAPQES